MLAGTSNGELPARLIVAIAPRDQRGQAQLAIPAAIAWYPLAAAVDDELDVELTWTSGPDTYRDLGQQTRGFLRRHTDTWTLEANGLKNRVANRRRWQSKTWYLRKGMAGIAVPGTSNHGSGPDKAAGAVDMSSAPRDRYRAVVAWLVEHADDWGWSAEVQSENWHWRVICGDQLPPKPAAWWAERTARSGAVGAHVLEAQRVLADLGLYKARIDGQYGPKTQAAIDRVRAHWQLGSGVLDPAVWVVLWHCRHKDLDELPEWK
jgi:hypothetical protein